LKIVFFGSSDFAKPSLKALVEAGFPPELVVTKPDAPRGRGRKIHPAPVRLAAESAALPCEQPEDSNSAEFIERLQGLKPDLGIVVSYGVIMTRDLFDLPAKGCINAHASLLPLYRGAAPVQHAIKDGQTETGITIMRISKALDAGDVLLVEKIEVGERETAGQLTERLAEMSGQTLVRACQQIAAGKDAYTPQDHSKATRAPAVEKPDGVLRWDRPAVEIDLLVRAMTPKPGAQTRLGAKRLIVLQGEVEQDLYGMGEPGRVQSGGEEGIRVCTGHDLFRITRIKPENGKNMTAGEFVRGHPLPPDARFG
jgi:methionyl-tRNA formyltransferase